MATKDQYAFFRALYEDEEKTYVHLESRGRFYFTIISLFVVALVLKGPETKASAIWLGIPSWLLSAAAVVLMLALVLLLIAVRIRTYEAVADPEDVAKSLTDATTDDDFLADRIADLTVATNRNVVVNNRVASFLLWTAICTIAAMVLLLAAFAATLVR